MVDMSVSTVTSRKSLQKCLVAMSANIYIQSDKESATFGFYIYVWLLHADTAGFE